MRSQNTIKWTVVPQETTLVRRTCPKCGQHSEYINTKKFRVNANGKHVDIWLIYQCKACKSTWNVSIFERVLVEGLDEGLYKRLMENDEALANDYGFNRNLLSPYGITMDISSLDYDIIDYNQLWNKLLESHTLDIEVICRYDIGLRVMHVLSKGLDTSISHIKRAVLSGLISVEGIKAKKLKTTELGQYKRIHISDVKALRSLIYKEDLLVKSQIT